MINNNTATTYVDNISDANLTATVPPVTDASKIYAASLQVQGGHALLLAQLTTLQRDALPALDGMMVYNTSAAAVQVHQGGVWLNV